MPWKCFGPSDSARRRSKELDKKILEWKKNDKAIKLLLLGAGESGKTTILKQMKIIHDCGFSDEEISEKTIEIRMNILTALQELLEIMRTLEPTIVLTNPNSYESAEYIKQLCIDDGIEFNHEFYTHAEALWNDNGIKQCLEKSHEYPIVDSAKYFLEKLSVIKQKDYRPSNQDILHSRKRTSDIKKIEFSVKIPIKYGGGGSQTFWMFDVGGQRGERRKWIQVFAGVQAVLFLVASNSFDSRIREDYETNSLQESLNLFELIWKSRFLKESSFILFLNKQDLLEEKIRKGISITPYFPDFEQYRIEHEEIKPKNEYEQTRQFIKDKFLDATKLRDEDRNSNRNDFQNRERRCYWHFTTATDTNNVKRVFDDIHTMILLQVLNTIPLI